ncbi:hypothetical protein VTN77DRAFT_9529 [Rasamsonia byssochlamydoides]|uniref:uncharacterized protein n=1 Tax=Rasamsonia byssochlamydoides TaxID=89139 RepID=UPI0037447653
MADVIGVVGTGVGVASLAIQVSEKIVALQSFLKSVKAAPEELISLLSEMHMLNEVLLDMQREPMLLRKEIANHCERQCSEAATALSTTLNHLQKRLREKKILGSIAFVLKKDDLDKCEATGADQVNAAACTLTEWTLRIKTHNIISRVSPIFEYAATGDIAAMQNLLKYRQGSVFDCDKKGWTPLHYAALYGMKAMCLFLLDEGADPYAEDNQSQTPVRVCTGRLFVMNFERLETAERERTVETSLELISETEDAFIGTPQDFEHITVTAILQRMLQTICPPLTYGICLNGLFCGNAFRPFTIFIIPLQRSSQLSCPYRSGTAVHEVEGYRKLLVKLVECGIHLKNIRRDTTRDDEIALLGFLKVWLLYVWTRWRPRHRGRHKRSHPYMHDQDRYDTHLSLQLWA